MEGILDYNSDSNEGLPRDSKLQKLSNNAMGISARQQQLMHSATYIPLRLSEHERKLLSVLENALEVCEYTDVVDVTFSYTKKSKMSRILDSLVDLLSISCGLLLSNNLSYGETLLANKTLTDNIPLFKDMFEIARRYKIMNPAKMRSTYGKLMYILMDTESFGVKQELKVDFVKPILTIHRFLKEKQSLELLEDERLLEAIRAIENDSNEKKTHSELQDEMHKKQMATKALLKQYVSETLSEDEIRRVIDSLADNNAYYAFNVRPLERMISILTEFFDPKHPDPNFSLDLQHRGFSNLTSTLNGFSNRYFGIGAKLSHSHSTQYTFVLQSLTLWREVMAEMPKLWFCADLDMTEQGYRLADTGQGYQRLQQCPRVSDLMHKILRHVQSKCSNWVGLSVIHLGDRDVPNALVFIDKYSQVPRILNPIVNCIEKLPSLKMDPAFHKYVCTEWNSISELRLQILSDFFKHGFDGSGDDGGSCIDGRLTSAWNWCSKLHKKPYYYVFMFCGFQGFDGDFK